MPVNQISMQQPTDFTGDNMEIQRRLAMAKALQDQSMQPIEQQTVSGRAVPISMWQGAAKLAQALAGRKLQSSAEEQAKTSASNYQEKLAQTLQAFGSEPDMQKKAAILMAHPATQAAGLKFIEQMAPQKPMVVGRSLINPQTNQVVATDETWKGEQEAARADKAAQAEAQRQQRAELANQQEALRREIAGQASSDRRMIAGMVNARQEQKNIPKLPTSALKMQQEELDAIATAGTINADLGALKEQVDTGKLPLGPMNNMLAKGRNAVGFSSPESQNFASFQATLEKMRNDSLRLNKGVQTEGDAQRAWNELVSNINDPKVVSKRLEEIQSINERAANIRRMNVDNIRQNFGVEAMDTSGYQKQPAAVGGSSASKNGKQFDSLPDPSQFKGKRMQAPDGTILKSNGTQWVKE